MRRFPCFCKPCLDKMKEPIELRYTGTNNNCEYRDIFNKSDGTSYNDWKLIKLSPKPKQYREEDDLARLRYSIYCMVVTGNNSLACHQFLPPDRKPILRRRDCFALLKISNPALSIDYCSHWTWIHPFESCSPGESRMPLK